MKLNQDLNELEKLKKGDEVATIHYRSGKMSDIRLTTVKTVTPTGRIKTANGYTFKSDGTEYGVGAWDIPKDLSLPTDEIRNYLEKEYLVNQIEKIKLDELPINTLREVYKILNP